MLVGLSTLKHIPPFSIRARKILFETFRPRQIRHATYLAPTLVSDPRVIRIHLTTRNRDASSKKEFDLCVGELAFCSHEACTKQEGKDELVLLEEGSAHHLVQEVGEMLVQIVEAGLKLCRGIRVVDCLRIARLHQYEGEQEGKRS